MIRRVGDIEIYNFASYNQRFSCVCLSAVSCVYVRIPQIVVGYDNVRIANSLIVGIGCNVLSVEEQRS